MKNELKRMKISSGGPFEKVFGYSRAVRVGDMVFVSGTGAIDPEEGKVVGVGDVYTQTVYVLKIISNALKQAGSQIEDVVKTRIYVTDINDWKGIAKGHSEFFGMIRPAAVMVEVTKLVLPEMLVEIECDAIVSKKS